MRQPIAFFQRRLGAAGPDGWRMAGAGALVAVGYMDPGNWATDIAGGTRFGYGLLFVVAASSLIAMALQALVVRVTVAAGTDIASLFRRAFPAPVALGLRLAGELAILATAVAELVGGAIALRLLFGLALPAGVALTAAGTFAVIALARGSAGAHERVVHVLIAVVSLSFLALLAEAKPDWAKAAAGAAPDAGLLRDPHALYLALGILGATIMPHNLYLHSGLVAARSMGLAEAARRQAIRLGTLDTVLALSVAMLVNGAILIVAAASLEGAAADVASLDGAHRAIGAALGPAAALIFALALYAAGQSSAITGVLAGRYLAQGFCGHPGGRVLRGLLTRVGATVIALALMLALGQGDPDALLVLSQVALSAALPFVLVPLVIVAAQRRLMGGFALRPAAALGFAAAAIGIVALNLYLLATAPLA
jgi:manganese transport protein